MPKEPSVPPLDPYWKLRPAPPTPDPELCHCEPCRELMLRDSLGPNPLYCLACNGEVAPDRIRFAEQLAEDIARWRSIHESLYVLWLDSGEYETWAADRLSDPHGTVNLIGREIVSRLNERIRTYYWWFNDIGVAEYVPPARCPVCAGELAACADREFQKCEGCSILV